MTWYVVSLCSGVGLFDLGLEWAGMRTVQFCEINAWRRDRLAQRFPGAVIHDDVHTLAPAPCEVVATGFPCPPTSRAGRQRAQEDERWIWPGVCDAIRRARPRYVIVENPPGILDGHGAFGDVLADLAALGFDAQWTCFPASSLGAPHRRDRLFLVAADPDQVDVWEQHGGFFGPGWGEAALAGRARPDGVVAADADADRESQPTGRRPDVGGGVGDVPASAAADAGQVGRGEGWCAWGRRRPPLPFVRRVDYGCPERVDRSERCEALGDAVVPQCAELVGLRLRQLHEVA